MADMSHLPPPQPVIVQNRGGCLAMFGGIVLVFAILAALAIVATIVVMWLA